MARSIYNTDIYREKLESVSSDILRNVRINKGFIIWMGILILALAACVFAYTIQLSLLASKCKGIDDKHGQNSNVHADGGDGRRRDDAHPLEND